MYVHAHTHTHKPNDLHPQQQFRSYSWKNSFFMICILERVLREYSKEYFLNAIVHLPTVF